MHDSTVDFLKSLINIPSVTPDDKGAQTIIANYLKPLGFNITPIDHPPVSNLWAQIGNEAPLVVFAGHTDVVDAGDLHHWKTAPFEATLKDNMLYGRGACDMKGSLAAMCFATKHFLKKHPRFKGSVGFLITSGEEGDQFDLGTPKVMEHLTQQGIKIDYCVIGEPSSDKNVGDMVKVGRRGSLTGVATVTGVQGHVAYPHLAKNPIHLITPALDALCQMQFDEGNAFFPPTSFQLSNIHSGTGAGNIIPGILTFKFNFRYSTEVTHEQLIERVESTIKQHCPLAVDIAWRHNGYPFLTEKSPLIDATEKAIESVMGFKPALSTSGGTSDGRFIAPYDVPVIELGPSNATIHKANEAISLDALSALESIYLTLLENLFI